MPRPLPAGSYWVSAGWRYSSGAGHYAYDLACPNYTKVFAPCDGKVAAIASHAHNNRPGESIWSGKRSNYILLHIQHAGRAAYVYLQHLSPPNTMVRVGQHVRAGQHIGYSGNSGNSSGPHLHYAAGWGHPSAAARYSYMNNNGGSSIFPPTKIETTVKEKGFTMNSDDKKWFVEKLAPAIANAVWQAPVADPVTEKKTTRGNLIRALRKEIRSIKNRLS